MLNKATKKNTTKLLALAGLFTASFALSNTASATIVEFQTSQGNFQVNLYDTKTPKTVDNFLDYLKSEHYTNSVVHRVQTDFIMQGGGYEFSGTMPLTQLRANAPVINEAFYSNVKGTIAMAKIGGSINSATNQWFFNLKDNNDITDPYNLDRQNGGFTVFGQVIGDGMAVVEKIGGLPLCYANSNGGIPMAITEEQTCSDMEGGVPGLENFVVINYVGIVDHTKVTDADLIIPTTKFPDTDGDGVKDIDDAFPNDPNKSVPDPVEADSGGSMTWFALMMMALVTTRKRLFSK